MTSPRNSWHKVSLGDICTFRYGKALPETVRAGGEVKVYGSNGVVGYHALALSNGSTIVIGRKGSFGEVNFSNSACWPIDTTYFIDRTATDQDLRWLYFRLSALGLNQLNKSAAVPGLNREDAYRQTLLIPPLSEQRRIAAILDQADALRAKRREALGQLDRLRQALFLGMFGEPTTNSRQWQTKPLIETCEEINDCPHSTPVWTEKGEICMRTSNLTAGGWNWSDTRYVLETTFEERSRRGHVRTGDIILSREGTIGIAAIVTSSMRVCMGQRLVQVRPSPSILVPEYLLRHLLYVLSPKRIGQVMVGSTSKHLNVRELKALRIPIPPIEYQLVFARRAAAIEKLEATHSSSLTQLNSLFNSLQHRAFRGEL